MAQAELNHVLIFNEHVRFCANKFEIGVNFMPNTPNYDRVVEMQALNEALANAFPDLGYKKYPWPEHERKLAVGTGWVASPTPRPIALEDPSTEIMNIARGRMRPYSASAAGRTAATATSPLLVLRTEPNSPVHRKMGRGDQRPESAGRGSSRFNTPGGSPSPSGGRRVDFAVGGAALNMGAHGLAVSTPPSPSGSPSPHPTSRLFLVSPAAKLAQGRMPSNFAAAAAGAASGSGSAAVRARMTVNATGNNFPLPGAPHRAARMSVNLANMQAAMVKTGSRPSSAKSGASGFTKDSPRIKYPDIQVGIFNSTEY
jgi:hypothetical protein